jgi:hypothetical protein
MTDTRFCHKCQTEKALTQFSKSKYTTYGVTPQCKSCNAERGRKWAVANKEKRNSAQKARREFMLANPEVYGEKMEALRLKNLATAKARRERRKITEPEVLKAERYALFLKSKDSISAYNRHKRKTDVNFKISKNMGNRLYAALKRYKNSKSWNHFLDYSMEDLRTHLASLFTEGMTWENYGAWHIDHVRPVSSFDFTDNTDAAIKECWALANLQPLWAIDNIRKNKYWEGNRASS